MPNLPTNKQKPMTLTALRDAVTQQLTVAAIPTPDLDARWLIEDLLDLGHAVWIQGPDYTLSDEQVTRVMGAAQQRASHVPLARITGHREFWGLRFGLNDATLEPRPDSETLIEQALRIIPDQGAPLSILDLGTGTGCLLLSLLYEYTLARGLGIDLAPRAIQQAKRNAKSLNLDQRAIFQTGHWLKGIGGKFDLIISNPPYIATSVLPTLMPEVREHDPMLALNGGGDGLDPYRLLIPQLKNFMNENAAVIFEIGFDQAEAVSDLLNKCGFQNITITKDLGGQDRCVSSCLR